MRILVTRPGADGQALAKLLRELGTEVVLEPILTIRELDVVTVNTDGVQAYLSTSANSVRALANTGPDFRIPLFAVGDTTAAVARQSGFKTVHSASGDATALANLVKDVLDPVGGSLIHVAGDSQTGDLNGELQRYGFECRLEVLYETETVKSLTAATVAAIKSDSIDIALLYSPKTAKTFVNLLRKSRLVRACRNTIVICLSQAVSDEVATVSWKKIIVAQAPTQEDLLAALTDYMDMGNGAQNKLREEETYLKPTEKTAPDSIDLPAQQRKGNGIRGIFFTLLVIAIIIVGGTATTDLWLPTLQKTFPLINLTDKTEFQLKSVFGRLQKLESESVNNIPRIEELETERLRLQRQLDSTLSRIRTVENSINTIKEMVSSIDNSKRPEVAKATLKNLVKRLGKLELDRSSAAFDSQKQLSQLTDQLVKLEKKMPYAGSTKTNGEAHAFLLAVGQLRSAILTGRPFFSELLALSSIRFASEVLSSTPGKIADVSKRGIPTRVQLREEFNGLAGKIVQTDKLPKGDSLLNRIVARLSHSLQWRRIDVLEGNGVEAIVARTERALKNGNLQLAVMELGALPENSTPTLQPWLENAQTLLTANKVLDALQVKAVSLLVAKE